MTEPVLDLTEHTLLMPYAEVVFGKVFENSLLVTFQYGTIDGNEVMNVLSIYDEVDTEYTHLAEDDDTELTQHVIVAIINNRNYWDLGPEAEWWM